METSTYTAARVAEILDEPFDEVTRRIESLAGRADLPRVRELLAPGGQAEQARRAIEAMAGPSGLMIFEQLDHGRLLALAGQDRRAMLYLIGNPLIAVEMTRHNVAADLYAPWRFLVYEGGDGKTRLTLVHENFPSTEARDNAGGGWPGFIDRLASLVVARR